MSRRSSNFGGGLKPRPASPTPPRTCGGPLPQAPPASSWAKSRDRSSVRSSARSTAGGATPSVHPDCRRRGVARALVAEVEKWLARQGAKRITALVEKDHPWATGFWQAVGYGVDQRIARHVR